MTRFRSSFLIMSLAAVAVLTACGAGGPMAAGAKPMGFFVTSANPGQGANLDELHGANMLTKQSALTETGQTIMGRGDATNLHDILTGSSPDGRAVSDGKDNTCGNWTKGGDGSALVGHHDRMGLNDLPPAKSWNSSHATQGCSLEALKKTGGGGLLYCFAAN